MKTSIFTKKNVTIGVVALTLGIGTPVAYLAATHNVQTPERTPSVIKKVESEKAKKSSSVPSAKKISEREAAYSKHKEESQETVVSETVNPVPTAEQDNTYVYERYAGGEDNYHPNITNEATKMYTPEVNAPVSNYKEDTKVKEKPVKKVVTPKYSLKATDPQLYKELVDAASKFNVTVDDSWSVETAKAKLYEFKYVLEDRGHVMGSHSNLKGEGGGRGDLIRP